MKKRKTCERCRRPIVLCLCASIPQLVSQTRVLVLQHKDEQYHALNTARLACLGLTNAECWVGERFDLLEDYVQQAALTYQPVVLCPSTNAQFAKSYNSLNDNEKFFKPYLLIIPDGTWKKARKIVYLNPLLQQLPHLTLEKVPASHYQLRKAREPNALSTIEAITYTLNTLEAPQQFDALLDSFLLLIKQQIIAMGETIYQQNYR